MLPGKWCGSDLAICRLRSGDSAVRAWIFRKFTMEAFRMHFSLDNNVPLYDNNKGTDVFNFLNKVCDNRANVQQSELKRELAIKEIEKTMTITYRGRTFTSFQEYISHSKRGELLNADATPLYAHPVDGWIINALNATPVNVMISTALDAIVSYQFGHQLASGIFIDQRSFPDLFEVLSHCAKTLGIAIPHAVAYHSEDALFNAFTSGTDEYAFIIISSALCSVYSKEEACFVVGHECGHIAARHMAYQTVVQILTGALISRVGNLIPPGFGPAFQLMRSATSIPLMAWARCSEITADRAGLLCCGDIKVAERALLHLVVGFADIDRVDIDDYLHKARQVEEFHSLSKLHKFFETHPQVPRRIEALRLFANSEPYYILSGKPRPSGETLLKQEQLNRMVSQILKS